MCNSCCGLNAGPAYRAASVPASEVVSLLRIGAIAFRAEWEVSHGPAFVFIAPEFKFMAPESNYSFKLADCANLTCMHSLVGAWDIQQGADDGRLNLIVNPYRLTAEDTLAGDWFVVDAESAVDWVAETYLPPAVATATFGPLVEAE